jgi:hypothetical protein
MGREDCGGVLAFNPSQTPLLLQMQAHLSDSDQTLTEYWNTDLKIAKEGIKTTCSICWPDLPPPPLSFRTCVD